MDVCEYVCAYVMVHWNEWEATDCMCSVNVYVCIKYHVSVHACMCVSMHACVCLCEGNYSGGLDLHGGEHSVLLSHCVQTSLLLYSKYELRLLLLSAAFFMTLPDKDRAHCVS